MIATLLAFVLTAHVCGAGPGHDDERWTIIVNTSANRAKVQVCIDNNRCGHLRVQDLRRSVDKSELLVGFKKGRLVRPPALPTGTEIMDYVRTMEVLATLAWKSPGVP